MIELERIFERLKMFFFIAGKDKFEKIKDDALDEVIAYYVFISLIYFAGLAIIDTIMGMGETLVLLVLWVLFLFFLEVILILVYYGFAKLLGGQGTLLDMFRVYAYAMTPANILGWIPFIGILGIMSLGNLIEGITAIFKLSRWRAIAVVFLPALILAAGIVLFFLLLGIALGGIIGY